MSLGWQLVLLVMMIMMRPRHQCNHGGRRAACSLASATYSTHGSASPCIALSVPSSLPYLAGKQVAIKVAPMSDLPNLKNEIALQKMSAHPNIVGGCSGTLRTCSQRTRPSRAGYVLEGIAHPRHRLSHLLPSPSSTRCELTASILLPCLSNDTRRCPTWKRTSAGRASG